VAKNFVEEGEVLGLAVASKKSGDPVVKGRVKGVALADTVLIPFYRSFLLTYAQSRCF
jgi:predicted RecA/RadA family phage recombinase